MTGTAKQNKKGDNAAQTAAAGNKANGADPARKRAGVDRPSPPQGAGAGAHPFQTEVGRLLEIVTNALYSEREIFLRELISNAADACDRLRYQAISQPELLTAEETLAIELAADAEARTLTVADNGVGMTRAELMENLGVIAHSGSAAFVEKMAQQGRDRAALIGQFGVGFYSAFMVADRVTVDSRAAGTQESWLWRSDGKSGFEIAPGARPTRGVTITLHLKEEATEFLQPERLRHIVRSWSNHVPFPVRLRGPEGKSEQINAAAALWARPRTEITEQEYSEFYRQITPAADAPWAVLHFRAEGVICYAGVLFIPETPPHDLFDPERKGRLKLYVRRVFITDNCQELLPAWLRFLRGVIDSEDLPLNVSREMLQNNPVVAKIRAALVNRVLGKLQDSAEKDAAGYARFWDGFGPVLKEGLYEDAENRPRLLELARFRSTTADGLTSLAEYVGRMKPGQQVIYYICGENADMISRSPQLEGFAAKGVEVLLMTDPVDEFWLSAVGEYQGRRLESVTRAGADLSAIADAPGDGAMEDKQGEDAPPATAEGLNALIAALKTALGDKLRDIRPSARLTDSAVCLVADGGMDIHLQRMLRRHGRLQEIAPRILELNPRHPLIRELAEQAARGADAAALTDAAWLLLDQARILEGEAPLDPQAFARRVSALMLRGG